MSYAEAFIVELDIKQISTSNGTVGDHEFCHYQSDTVLCT